MASMTEPAIPMVDLGAQHRSLRRELDDAIDEVRRRSAFIGGDACRKFEEEFARFCGVGASCGVASGTDAVYLALRGLGIGPGDEVITTPFTFVATAEAISRVGARIVFADIKLGTYNIDPSAVEAAVTSRTRALLPVHLYGLPAEMEALASTAARSDSIVVEDAAQAHGAAIGTKRVGTFGRVACFSFFPSKNLGAMGDAGAIVSNDNEVIDRIRRLADHGSRAKYMHEMEGISSRLDGLQAAILSVKLPHVEKWNDMRREVALRYRDGLACIDELTLPEQTPGTAHVYHQFTIRLGDRDALREHLRNHGIASAVHYPCPLHLQEAYRHLELREGAFPNAERAAREVLSLPMYPEMSPEQTDRVVHAIRSFFRN
jgi:dTDP-4-amino-4,6-dideoxygalactose transaminase